MRLSPSEICKKINSFIELTGVRLGCVTLDPNHWELRIAIDLEYKLKYKYFPVNRYTITGDYIRGNMNLTGYETASDLKDVAMVITERLETYEAMVRIMAN